MTREAKIGMLTGLCVIVLIGVLLSQYLGAPSGSGLAAGNEATGRMARLEVGSGLRHSLLQPVGVPGMQHAAESSDARATGVMSIPTAYAEAPAESDALVPGQAAAQLRGPVIGAPVQAIPVAPAPAPAAIADAGGVHTVRVATADGLQPSLYVPGSAPRMAASGREAASAAPAAVGETYKIIRLDTLTKIAKKFYGTSDKAAQQRIIAANPSILRNGKPWLIAGKTLVIPPAPAVVREAEQAARPADGRTARAGSAGGDTVMIGVPGSRAMRRPAPTSSQSIASSVAGGRAARASVYVVKKGDSLEKIAKHFAAKDYRAEMKKIAAVNGIKNVDVLREGQALRVPE